MHIISTMIKYILILLLSYICAFGQNQIGLTEARSLHDMNVTRQFILMNGEYQTIAFIATKYLFNNDSVFVSLNRITDNNYTLQKEECYLVCKNNQGNYEQIYYTTENMVNWMMINGYKKEEISIIVLYSNEMFIW